MSDPLTLIHGDALSSLRELEDESVQTCVTSPPYWGLRDYGHEWQIGLEKTPEEYVARLVEVFREVKRVLRKDGTLWLNLGDSYFGANWRGSEAIGSKQATNRGANGSQHSILASDWRGMKHPTMKPKDLVGIPWLVAFALRADGWYLRSDIIWSKPNPMPESVTDRPTKSHEYIFLLSRRQKYFFNQDAVKEPIAAASIPRLRQDVSSQVGTVRANGGAKSNGNFKAVGDIETGRNIRSVWTVTTQPFSDAHFATFPPDLIKPCILAGAPIGGAVLDPFAGSGTTGKVAIELGRKAVLIEPKAEYVEMIKNRCQTTIGLPLG